MMSRGALVLLVGLLVPAAAGPGPKSKRIKIRAMLTRGGRYLCSNMVSYTTRTTTRQGESKSETLESVQRTERFIDRIVRAGENGIAEIRRDYLLAYTKTRNSEHGRPTVHNSPMRERSVIIRENRRRRDVQMVGRGVIDPLVRRVVGMEIDWRDIFPEDAVGPGDVWDAEVTALGRRMAAYLRCGTRAKMRVRYEANVEVEGSPQAKLYIDWTLEGMRDRRLFTKVTLAGDVFFDFKLKRVVKVDLAGTMVVRGAIVGDKGPPSIIKGEGPVTILTTVAVAPEPQAAPHDDG